VGEHDKHESDDDAGSCAADEPTAIWDAEALRAAGLDAILSQPLSEPPKAPATAPIARVEPSMVVDDGALDAAGLASGLPSMEAGRITPSAGQGADSTGPQRVPAVMRVGNDSVPARRYGWPTAIGAGVAFFAVVYAAIRYLR
jgi:hypothetical protein